MLTDVDRYIIWTCIGLFNVLGLFPHSKLFHDLLYLDITVDLTENYEETYVFHSALDIRGNSRFRPIR